MRPGATLCSKTKKGSPVATELFILCQAKIFDGSHDGGADEGEDENGNGNRHEACKHDKMNMKRGSA